VKKFGFPKTSRLKRETDFELVFKKGRKTVTDELVLWQSRRAPLRGPSLVSGQRFDSAQCGETVGPSAGNQRIGIIVSRKHGDAVRRNRLKRLFREAFRLNIAGLRKGIDIIICPRIGLKCGDFLSAQNALIRIWKKAGIYTGPKAVTAPPPPSSPSKGRMEEGVDKN